MTTEDLGLILVKNLQTPPLVKKMYMILYVILRHFITFLYCGIFTRVRLQMLGGDRTVHAAAEEVRLV